MNLAHETGWTMDTFVRWAFGPRSLAYLAVDVDLAQRSAALLERGERRDETRRRLALLTRAIEATADAHFLQAEGHLAGILAGLLEAQHFEPWMLARLRTGYASLERMVAQRLATMGLLLRRSSGGVRLSAAA
jgi:hypothetical protein